MNLNENPTKEELKKLICDCDEKKWSHQLYVKKSGDVLIAEENDGVVFNDDVQFWADTFTGEGHVGEDAANDSKYIDILFNYLVKNWKLKSLGHIVELF